eukprot:Filipodium_phascolosomae@DN303_c0_g1_i1.p1
MWVNNEIGVIQPMSEIGAITRKHDVLLHTDAAQAIGKVSVDVEAAQIDLMSMSGHKIYGPKGIGALYVRSKPRVRLAAIIDGGGQERGMRSGTLPAPLVVGMGKACEVCQEEIEADHQHVATLTTRLKEGIMSQLTEVHLNGSADHRYVGNLNLSFSDVEGESLIMKMEDYAVSSGSACTSATLEPSYVLRAIGVDEGLAHTSIRFGIGRFNTMEEIEACIEAVVHSVNELRRISPTWEAGMKSGEEVISWT